MHVSLGGAIDSEYQSHSCPALSSRSGACMSHVFQVPDDLYSEVAAYAAQRGQTPHALLIALVTGGVDLLKRVESTVPTHAGRDDPPPDSLAPSTRAFAYRRGQSRR